MYRVVALAGRRVDLRSMEPSRFPSEAVDSVRNQLRSLFRNHQVQMVVCSAASGADLLALEAAGELGLRRRVVLPFTPDRFRETSVVDRQRCWGQVYDHIIDAAQGTADLIILEEEAKNSLAYRRTNERILDEAMSVAGGSCDLDSAVLAVLVWEGMPKGSEDSTAHFGELARERGLEIEEIRTR